MRIDLVSAVVASVFLAGCSSCNPPNAPAAPAPSCEAPVVAAASQEGPCGPPPTSAAPGETWCCVPVEVPGAAPQRICVQEESSRCIEVPAVYQSVSEQVLVHEGTPGHSDWRRVECTAAQTSAGQSECWQLVETPATPPVYESRCREVMVQEATKRYERIPARFEEVPAAPSMIWRWKRFENCEGNVAPAAPVAPVAVPAAAPAKKCS